MGSGNDGARYWAPSLVPMTPLLVNISRIFATRRITQRHPRRLLQLSLFRLSVDVDVLVRCMLDVSRFDCVLLVTDPTKDRVATLVGPSASCSSVTPSPT